MDIHNLLAVQMDLHQPANNQYFKFVPTFQWQSNLGLVRLRGGR